MAAFVIAKHFQIYSGQAFSNSVGAHSHRNGPHNVDYYLILENIINNPQWYSYRPGG